MASEQGLVAPNSAHGGTWEHVARLIHDHPEVKQVRLDQKTHRVAVGFYQLPSDETLQRIQSDVRRELSGEWGMLVEGNGELPRVHLHRINRHAAEFHQAHPPYEPRVIWKRVSLPAWRNRSVRHHTTRDYRLMLLLAGCCGISTLIALLLRRAGFHGAPIAFCFLLAYVSGSWFTAQEVLSRLRSGGIDIHFLMIAVAIGALFVDAPVEGATLLFLFSLSNALEEFANYRTHKSIESLLKIAPKFAWRRAGSSWIEVPVEEIQSGDELLVKAGELFPVDGVLIEGATSADESTLTGEAIPIVKKTGDRVSGGTLNIDGQAIIRATAQLGQSALQRIIALIEEAQQQKAPAQRFTDIFSRYYTWVALSLAALVFCILLATRHPATNAFYRAMTVLVVASPCALVLSVPSAILVAIAAGARRGILFRGGVAIENLAGATHVAMDKTGTLTKGALVVERIEAFENHDEDEVLQIAASVARYSTHPLSRAIVIEAQRRKLQLTPAHDFLNVPGLGMEANVNGKRIFAGNRMLMRDRGVALPSIPATNDAEVWVSSERPIGLIYLRDQVRPESKDVVQFLKRHGLAVTLLTGDRAEPAQLVAQQVGITDVRAALSPQAKLQSIHDWRVAGKKVVMIGDGINDAPSLTAADVSIGMGARGSDAALEQADIILMHDKIENVQHAFRLSRRARAVIRQNISISLGVIFLLLISALLQKINLTTGVIGHEGSTVLVILNGLRLLRSR